MRILESWMKKKIFTTIFHANNIFGVQAIYNIGSGLKGKKALLSYITSPFCNPHNTGHTNKEEVIEIVYVLNLLGYSVDVIRLDFDIVIDKEYDLIIGQGAGFKVNCDNNPNALKIIYLTESSPSFSLEREKHRYKGIKNSYLLKSKRTNKYLNNEMIDVADKAILIGNEEETKKTYSEYSIYNDISTIEPTSLRSASFCLDKGSDSSRNIVWFGSSGVIHKGLDIAIKAVMSTKSGKLYVAGCTEKDFKMVLKEIGLSKKDVKNKIIFKGKLTVGSEECNKVLKNCAFTLLPSCSEGMSTSILTCLAHGIIPIISKYTGIDMKESIYIESLDTQGVLDAVNKAFNIPNSSIDFIRNDLLKQYKTRFTLDEYHDRLLELLNGHMK